MGLTMAMRLIVMIGGGNNSNYFSPSGNIQSTNINDAIRELDTEKAKKQITKFFNQADLTVANLLLIEHQPDFIPGNVAVWNSDSEQIIPDKVSTVGNNYVCIDLAGFAPLSGDYKAVISE